jgi:hypothetical protein
MEFNVGGRVPVNWSYVAIGHLLLIPWRPRLFCASCGKFAADIPNYSNVVGELQISDIV